MKAIVVMVERSEPLLLTMMMVADVRALTLREFVRYLKQAQAMHG